MISTVGHLQILGSCDNIVFQRPVTDPHLHSLVSMSPQYVEELRTQMMLSVVALHINQIFRLSTLVLGWHVFQLTGEFSF